MTAREVARCERVDPATVRRWPARGLPVARAGGKGPGRATLFDLDQVRRWRGRQTAPSGMTDDEALQMVAAALYESLEKLNCDIRADCSRQAAAHVLLLGFQSCEELFKRNFGVHEQPQPIRALMRILVE